jgi:hypothetical protein
MRLRRISKEEVEAVLADYHTSYQDRNGNSVFIGHVERRRIKVVVAKGSSPAFIITAAD